MANFNDLTSCIIRYILLAHYQDNTVEFKDTFSDEIFSMPAYKIANNQHMIRYFRGDHAATITNIAATTSIVREDLPV